MLSVLLKSTHLNKPVLSRAATRDELVQKHTHMHTHIHKHTHSLTDSFGVVPGPQQELRGPVPECHHHRVKVRQRLQWRVKESGETHVSYRKCGEKTEVKQKHYQREEYRMTLSPKRLSWPHMAAQQSFFCCQSGFRAE